MTEGLIDLEDERNTRVDIDAIESKLTGKTLKVYWYLLRNLGGARLRDIQRNTNLSTPSLASYHLEKLKDLDLVEADSHGSFYPKRIIKVGVLKLFMGQGRLMVPRYLFYAIFYVSVLLGTMIVFPFTFGPLSFLLYSVLIFGIITSILEARNAWSIEI